MKIPPHIMLDYSVKPNEYVCEHCGKRRPVHLPAPIDDFLKQGEAFAISHKRCKPCAKETTE
jgi:hypothetical protein